MKNWLSKKEKFNIVSPFNTKIIQLENIPDQAFSNKLIGDGLAILINEINLYAPCEGIIDTIAPSQHAFIIQTKNKAKILVHIGLDSQKLLPAHCHYHVKTGDYVTPETLILTLSEDFLKINNYSIITPIVILNCQKHPIQTMTTATSIKKGKILFTFK